MNEENGNLAIELLEVSIELASPFLGAKLCLPALAINHAPRQARPFPFLSLHFMFFLKQKQIKNALINLHYLPLPSWYMAAIG